MPRSATVRKGTSIFVDILMGFIFLLLISFALWLVWVTYFREYHDAGIIEVSYSDGIIDVISTGDSHKDAARFHNKRLLESTEKSLSACILCHGDYPHSEAKDVRAYLNAHSYLMTCEVCHFKFANTAAITYRWLDVKENTIAESQTAGIRFKIIQVEYRNEAVSRFDDDEDLDSIRQYADKMDKLNDAFREAIVKETHDMLSQEAVACKKCHSASSEPLKLYADLGYGSDRTRELQRIEVIGMIEKYHDFYMPKIIE